MFAHHRSKYHSFLFYHFDEEKSYLTVSEGKNYLRKNIKRDLSRSFTVKFFNGAADEHQHTIYFLDFSKKAKPWNSLILSGATSYVLRKGMHVRYFEKIPLDATETSLRSTNSKQYISNIIFFWLNTLKETGKKSSVDLWRIWHPKRYLSYFFTPKLNLPLALLSFLHGSYPRGNFPDI